MNVRIYLWKRFTRLYPWFLRKFYKMEIGDDVRVSWKAHLDKSVNPKGIHIGSGTRILNGAMVLSHDDCRLIKADTYIGRDCLIGIRSIIMPGVSIGDSVLVGAGAIVTKDVPANSMVVGNPAKVIKEGVMIKKGRLIQPGVSC